MFDDAFIARFNLKWRIAENGCWEWTASKMPKGYGQMKLPRQRRQEFAHRISYTIHRGEIPKGKHVCHKCDNPSCVNPLHLFLGTSHENHVDMVSKGRHLYGEKNGNSKLTEDDVRKIKRLLSDGLSQTKIATMFGIQQMQVSRIKNGVRWRHLN